MEQIISHLLGDYIFQNSYIANTKTKNTLICILHCVIYASCFSWFASINQIVLIGLLHFPIDRFRLAKYWIMLVNIKSVTTSFNINLTDNWFKKGNLIHIGNETNEDCLVLESKVINQTQTEYKVVVYDDSEIIRKTIFGYISIPNTLTGFRKETPIWLSTWLLFIIDNIFHLVINYSIIKFIE